MKSLHLYHIGVVGVAVIMILVMVPMPWSIPLVVGLVVLWISRTARAKHAGTLTVAGLALTLVGVVGAIAATSA